jgi:hypothetical protein
LEIKLTHFPSGEKLGELALPTRAIRATAAARSVFALAAAPAGWALGAEATGWLCPAEIALMQQTRTAKADLRFNMVSSPWCSVSDQYYLGSSCISGELLLFRSVTRSRVIHRSS